ncbi:MAG: protein phosphatase 2C domain-containing protein, partial [Gemmiger sp.]
QFLSKNLPETRPGEEKQTILRGFDIANRAVYDKATSDPDMLGMGTTGVCAYVASGAAHLVHAGDSRAYLFHDSQLRQITRDHSMVQQLVDSGKITRDQAANHPQKNLITRALGVSSTIVPEYNRCPVQAGDILLLCTDGLTNMVPDEEIRLILIEAGFFSAPDILLERALQAGGQDNITIMLIGVETTEGSNG